jgi:hypothetical protein
MTESETARGRVEFIASIALGVVVFLGIGVAAWLRSGDTGGVATFGRPIVLLALGALASGGRRWARTAATFWMGLIALVLAASAIPVIGDHPGAGAFFLGIGLLFGGAAFRLQTSSAIDMFLDAQREQASSISRAS